MMMLLINIEKNKMTVTPFISERMRLSEFMAEINIFDLRFIFQKTLFMNWHHIPIVRKLAISIKRWAVCQ